MSELSLVKQAYNRDLVVAELRRQIGELEARGQQQDQRIAKLKVACLSQNAQIEQWKNKARRRGVRVD